MTSPDSAEQTPKALSSDVQEKLRSRILLSLALAAAVYLGFMIWSDWRSFATSLSSFPPLLLVPVLALSFLNYVARWYKFHLYLGLLDIELPRRKSFLIFLSGLAGTVTPGKLGEVLKSVFIERETGAAISRTAPIIIAERFTDLLALLLLTAIGLGDLRGGWLTVGAGFGFIGAILIFVGQPRLVHRLLDWMTKRSGAWETVSTRARTAYKSTSVMLSWRNIPFATLVSVLAWFCECLGFWLVLSGFGISISIERATFTYCLATTVGALVMMPGGIGPTEGSMTALLLRWGAKRSPAVAATLLVRACTLWFAVLVGVVALTRLSSSSKAVAN